MTLAPLSEGMPEAFPDEVLVDVPDMRDRRGAWDTVKKIGKGALSVLPLKRQLMRFGNVFSSIGNKLGGFTGRVTTALDKLCEVIKTIIPVVAAVCHVGQFQFCGSVMDAPNELANALAPSSIDLSIQD
ncbi:hypothetical protein RN001_004809 [Aquatica leii]|uniref:Uncharacterized protein n=1 Tax=Aquatica leii TaxID=1421715 RepID=A0AAN7SRW1_9COLE|nr:hypothetical protein RN001_004809 [Aquatica leii]